MVAVKWLEALFAFGSIVFWYTTGSVECCGTITGKPPEKVDRVLAQHAVVAAPAAPGG